jgi:hypothetical protein
MIPGSITQQSNGPTMDDLFNASGDGASRQIMRMVASPHNRIRKSRHIMNVLFRNACATACLEQAMWLAGLCPQSRASVRTAMEMANLASYNNETYSAGSLRNEYQCVIKWLELQYMNEN